MDKNIIISYVTRFDKINYDNRKMSRVVVHRVYKEDELICFMCNIFGQQYHPADPVEINPDFFLAMSTDYMFYVYNMS